MRVRHVKPDKKNHRTKDQARRRDDAEPGSCRCRRGVACRRPGAGKQRPYTEWFSRLCAKARFNCIVGLARKKKTPCRPQREERKLNGSTRRSARLRAPKTVANYTLWPAPEGAGGSERAQAR